MTQLKLFTVMLCNCVLLSTVPAQRVSSDYKIQLNRGENSVDLGMPILARTKRQSSNVPPESPVRIGGATDRVVDGVTRLTANIPQYTVEDRHYWPSDYSLTARIGLQGINSFIDDVVNYDRTKAMALARDASCRQRDNCRWNQRFATLGNLFRSLSNEQKLVQNVDCDSIFAGCRQFH